MIIDDYLLKIILSFSPIGKEGKELRICGHSEILFWKSRRELFLMFTPGENVVTAKVRKIKGE